MSNKFISAINKELDSATELTENGAVAYATAGGEGKNLVDFNFQISSMRGWDAEKIKGWYAKVYFENKELATKYWAFCADCRGGLGERRTSNIIFDWLIDNSTDVAKKLLPLIPYYGRWDSLAHLIENSAVSAEVADIISKQLRDDLTNCRKGESFSLCAKWLPSENTSSNGSKRMARVLANKLELTPKQYRKMLSELRKGLRIVERSMSSNKWDEIDYNAVPSKANLLYKNSFLKHDETRRNEYLEKLSSGDKSVKINSSAAFPCDILHKYMNNGSYWSLKLNSKDTTIEEMWKALPNYLGDNASSVLAVVDTSGSMMSRIGTTNMTAWEVAQSLGIYFSQHLCDAFKDKYIMFSENPKFVDMSNCTSLHDKLAQSLTYNECSNTNFAKTMHLVLNTAINNHLEQKDIPTILVISDMNFDCYGWNGTLMSEIEKEFNANGYALPKTVWFNVCGGQDRHAPIPLQISESGTVLISGFSPSILDMVFSNNLSPYKCLVDKLNSERYEPVAKVL